MAVVDSLAVFTSVQIFVDHAAVGADLTLYL
jgi:hypothetical protein